MGKYWYSAPHQRKPTVFYHGTTDAFGIVNKLQPASVTGNLREEWRKSNTDQVFLTTSLASAKNYAKKACEKYGGEPVVYECKPIGSCYNRVSIEYVCNAARVIRIVPFNEKIPQAG